MDTLLKAEASNLPSVPTSMPWQWDVQKELNNQVGRLATLLGLIVTASALTLSSDPVEDVLTHPDGLNLVPYASVAVLAVSLVVTAFLFVDPMSNPAPIRWFVGQDLSKTTVERDRGPVHEGKYQDALQWSMDLKEVHQSIKKLATLIAGENLLR